MEKPLITKDMMKEQLKQIGITEGMTVIVHSSLSSIGWVNGGEVTVIQALMETLTEEGTLIMPTQSGDLSDPSEWGNPPVPEEWWDSIRETMPAYDQAYTPTLGMGRIPELFRTYPGVQRSGHPAVSFAAWGKDKEAIIDGHALEFGLGEQSPLEKLYSRNAHVLLLGVDYSSNTSFHLAEYQIPHRVIVEKGSPLLLDGERVWKKYEDIETKEELFQEIGMVFEQEHDVVIGQIGTAETRLFSMRSCVDFARKWLGNYDESANN